MKLLCNNNNGSVRSDQSGQKQMPKKKVKHSKRIWYLLWGTFSAFSNLKLMDYLRQRCFLTVLGCWTVNLSFTNPPGLFWIYLHFWHLQYPMARSFTAYLLTATSSCLIWGYLLAISTLFSLDLSLKKAANNSSSILGYPVLPPSWYFWSLVWVKLKRKHLQRWPCNGKKKFLPKQCRYRYARKLSSVGTFI